MSHYESLTDDLSENIEELAFGYLTIAVAINCFDELIYLCSSYWCSLAHMFECITDQTADFILFEIPVVIPVIGCKHIVDSYAKVFIRMLHL